MRCIRKFFEAKEKKNNNINTFKIVCREKLQNNNIYSGYFVSVIGLENTRGHAMLAKGEDQRGMLQLQEEIDL